MAFTLPNEYAFLQNDPDFANLPDAEKQKFLTGFQALPADVQNQAKTQLTASTTVAPTTAQPQAPATPEEKVNSYFQRYLGRQPTQRELETYVVQERKGEDTSVSIRNMPEASSYGTSPTWGTSIGGVSLPTAPNLADISAPTAGKLVDYGQTVGDQSMPTYGNTINGLSLAQYGQSVGGYKPYQIGQAVNGYTDVKYGDTVAGLNTVKYGDAVNNINTAKYGDVVGGVGPVAYGQTIAGLTPVQYGKAVGDINLQRYGETIAGQVLPNYDAIVTDPLSKWRFEETPAYQAKSQMMNETLQNQLSARGGLRGAPAVNLLTEQNRKLYSDSYDYERQLFINNAVARYQAKGLAYQDAYKAALNEYNTAYGANEAKYNTALQSGTEQYNTALANQQQLYNTAYGSNEAAYNAALTNRQQQYKNAYDTAMGAYNTALANNQAQYGQAYAGALTNYGQAVSSQNTNTMNTFNMANQEYNNRLNQALQNYNLGLQQYANAYGMSTAQAATAYNELLNAAKIGQGAAESTSTAGNTSTVLGTNTIKNAGDAAATGKITQGNISSGVYGNIGTVIPSTVGMYQGYKDIFGISGGGTSSDTGTNYLGAFSSPDYVLGSGGKSVTKPKTSTFSTGLGSVPTTTTSKKTTTKNQYDPTQTYSFNM